MQKKKIKPTLKLHNFRYDCTKSQFISKHVKNNETCLACGLHNDNKFFNKYFENSYLKSFFVNYYGKKYFKIIKNYNLNLVVLTNFHKKYLKEFNLIEKEITVIPNIIELPKLEDNNMNKNYFVYAGRVSKEKGVKELMDVFNELNLDETKLKIIGNGPIKESLMNKNENKNIEFIDFLPNAHVIELIKNSIAVVTATKLYEGQPTLLCEASANGIPSIFPKTGGISEFFPESYEYSFEQFDYEDLKEKMLMALNYTKRKEIGLENRSFLDNSLDKKKILKKFENLINE